MLSPSSSAETDIPLLPVRITAEAMVEIHKGTYSALLPFTVAFHSIVDDYNVDNVDVDDDALQASTSSM